MTAAPARTGGLKGAPRKKALMRCHPKKTVRPRTLARAGPGAGSPRGSRPAGVRGASLSSRGSWLMPSSRRSKSVCIGTTAGSKCSVTLPVSGLAVASRTPVCPASHCSRATAPCSRRRISCTLTRRRLGSEWHTVNFARGGCHGVPLWRDRWEFRDYERLPRSSLNRVYHNISYRQEWAHLLPHPRLAFWRAGIKRR